MAPIPVKAPPTQTPAPIKASPPTPVKASPPAPAPAPAPEVKPPIFTPPLKAHIVFPPPTSAPSPPPRNIHQELVPPPDFQLEAPKLYSHLVH
ncbi:hypothetical protein AgCh_017263 [Apium graveolens]